MTDSVQTFEIGVDAPIEGNDWLIQNVVKIAEAGAGMSVILTTPGGLVAGRVISGAEYFQKLSDSFRTSGSEPVYGVLADWAASFKPVGENPADAAGPYFIHLENASLSTPSNMTSPHALWRGKISAVSAIAFGTLS